MPEETTPTTSTSLVRIQTDPQGGTGTVAAYFQTKTEVAGETFTKPMTSVSWGINSQTPVSITLGDLTEAETTRAALFAAVSSIAYEEKALKEAPPPAPEPAPEIPE